MKTRTIEIENSNGEGLHALLEMPDDGEVQQYAIFAHCFTCNSAFHVVKNISRELTRYGFGVVRFDFTGLGGSEGAFEDTNFTHNIEDLKRVAAHMEEEYSAPALLIGHSLGGAAVVLAGAEMDSVQAIVTIGAPSGPEHVEHLFSGKVEEIQKDGKAQVSIGGRPFVLKKQFIEDLQKHTMTETLESMRKAFLFMHSPQDKIVGIDQAAKLYNAAHHPKSFISLDGADHLLSDEKDSLYAARTIGTWAQRYVDSIQPRGAR